MAIFGSTNDNAVVKAHKATVHIGNIEAIALDVSITFQRPVENVPVIGPKNVIAVGRPQGQFTAQCIMVKDFDAVKAFHLEDGDDCTTFEMQIDLSASCDMTGGRIDLAGCVASAVSIQIQGGRGYIIIAPTVTFTQLSRSLS